MCNGYTRIIRSCPSEINYKIQSVEEWQKQETWPDNTNNRTLNCSSLTWIEIVNNQTSLDDWGLLAREYIAAQLNILSGASDYLLNEDLDSAEELLNKCDNWTSDEIQEGQNLQSKFHSFNLGTALNLESKNEADAHAETTSSNEQRSDPHLLFLVFLPAGILVIVAIIGAVIFIRKKRQVTEA